MELSCEDMTNHTPRFQNYQLIMKSREMIKIIAEVVLVLDCMVYSHMAKTTHQTQIDYTHISMPDGKFHKTSPDHSWVQSEQTWLMRKTHEW